MYLGKPIIIMLFMLFSLQGFCIQKIVVAKATGLPSLYKMTNVDYAKKKLYDKYQIDAFSAGLAKLKSSPYQVEVIEFADSYSLFNAFQDPQVVAFIFVGHLRSNSKGEGIGILDDFGFDISPILFSIPKNIRYVALMGCNSYDLVQKIRKKAPQIFKHTNFLSFKKKIPLDEKFFKFIAKKTLSRLRKLPQAPIINPTTKKLFLPEKKLSLKRHCPNKHLTQLKGLAPSVLVRFESERNYIASFPSCLSKGEVQEISIRISEDKLDKILRSGVGLIASIGTNELVDEAQYLNEFIGKVEVSGDQFTSSMQMDLFDETRPLGITEHLINLHRI